MSNIRALILGAGRGTRLGMVGEEVPKALLEVGGKPLIQHLLDTLGDAGVGPVHIVVGYEAGKIREAVGVQAEYIHNPRWACTNSLYSFWLARNAIRGDVLVFNSDVLFAPEILDRLLDTPGDAIAIDSSSGSGREHMKVSVEGGRVVKMSKTLPAGEVSGENLGILKLTSGTARVLFDRADEMIASGRVMEWLGAAVAAAAPGLDLRAVDVAGAPWVEIDFAVDLVRARKEVWPAINGNAYRRHRVRRTAMLALATGFFGGAMLLGGLGLAPELPAPETGQTVPIETLRSALIDPDRQPDGWLRLGQDQIAEAHVVGPGQLCIDLQLMDPAGSNVSCEVEAAIDGAPIDRRSVRPSPPPRMSQRERTAGDGSCETTDLPAGPHLLRLRVVSPPEASCLVRVRRLESDAE